MSDEDGPADAAGSGDEGLISRFWKDPAPVVAPSEPTPPAEAEAEEG